MSPRAVTTQPGLLVVDKPSGPTSFDVVRRVRRALQVRRAGHTGTLDPAATGVLPICLGEATKIVRFLAAQDKRYRAVARLGVETDTLDATGRVLRELPVPVLCDSVIEEALSKLRGRIRQRPPAYSAVHVGGERAMVRARRGEGVLVPEREVEVHSLTLVGREGNDVGLDVTCGKGTYVRSLVASLGASLGCGAHLVALRRERVGPFCLERAVPLDLVERDAEAARAALLSPAEALASLPSVVVDSEGARRVRLGQPLQPTGCLRADPARDGEPLRCLDESGALVAVAVREGGLLRPLRVLLPDARV